MKFRSYCILMIICPFCIYPGVTDSMEESSQQRSDPSEPYVIGGKETKKHEYRFLVLLQKSDAKLGDAFCHGVLVAPQIVLGTSHKNCLAVPKENIWVLAGMHDVNVKEKTVQIRQVCHLDVHPKATKTNWTNAYTIYHLSDPFDLNEYVGTISLPPKSKIKNGDTCEKNTCTCTAECMYAGWGRPQGVTALRHIPLALKPCSNDGTFFCTYQGPCHDMGSPLVCAAGNRQFAAGVYAFSDCNHSQSPAYFASFISESFKTWYKEKVRGVPQSCHAKHG